MKIFIQTFLGIVALIAGVSLLYFFISRLNSGFNFIFLLLALVFMGAGVFLFIRVSKLANSIPETSVEVAPAESGSKLLERNNQMIQDWKKTNQKNESLKAVEIAASAQAQATKEQGTS